MKQRKSIDKSVDQELSSLSKRLVKVGQYERICREFGLKLTSVKNFSKSPPPGTTLRTYRVIEKAVIHLEKENERQTKGLHKK